MFDFYAFNVWTNFYIYQIHICSVDKFENLCPYKNLPKGGREKVDKGFKKMAAKIKKRTGIVVRNIGHGNTGGGLVGKKSNFCLISAAKILI